MRVRWIAPLLFACSLLIASQAAGRGIGFLPFAPYPSGDQPIDLASADLDGDGDQDLAVSQFAVSASGVTIFRNEGAGSFQSLGFTSVPGQADGIVARRVDGDDDPDLVIGTLDDEIHLMRGQAGATFSAPNQLDVGGNRPRKVAVGDVNGDTRQDIVFSTQNTDEVGVALQRVNETFKPPRLRSGGGGPVATAKLNGDGRADVAVLSQDGKVRTLVGAAKGKLKLVAARGAGPNWRDMELGDLNADGDPDIAIANGEFNGQGSNIASVIRGLGGGKLSQRKEYVVDPPALSLAARRGPDSLPTGVVIADLGNSPREDLAVTLGEEGADLVAVLRSNAGQPGIDLANPDFFPTGTDPLNVIVAQLDGLGSADLAITRSSADAVSVLFSLVD